MVRGLTFNLQCVLSDTGFVGRRMKNGASTKRKKRLSVLRKIKTAKLVRGTELAIPVMPRMADIRTP